MNMDRWILVDSSSKQTQTDTCPLYFAHFYRNYCFYPQEEEVEAEAEVATEEAEETEEERGSLPTEMRPPDVLQSLFLWKAPASVSDSAGFSLRSR
jgi:hypothetical protein